MAPELSMFTAFTIMGGAIIAALIWIFTNVKVSLTATITPAAAIPLAAVPACVPAAVLCGLAVVLPASAVPAYVPVAVLVCVLVVLALSILTVLAI